MPLRRRNLSSCWLVVCKVIRKKVCDLGEDIEGGENRQLTARAPSRHRLKRGDLWVLESECVYLGHRNLVYFKQACFARADDDISKGCRVMHPRDVIKIQFSCHDDALCLFILANLMQTCVPPAACLHIQFEELCGVHAVLSMYWLMCRPKHANSAQLLFFLGGQ